MPRFAANLSMLWPELDVYDRFAAAANAGFRRVEILFVHALDRHRIADISLSLTHSATSASAVALALPRETHVPRIGRLLWKYAPLRRNVKVTLPAGV